MPGTYPLTQTQTQTQTHMPSTARHTRAPPVASQGSHQTHTQVKSLFMQQNVSGGHTPPPLSTHELHPS